MKHTAQDSRLGFPGRNSIEDFNVRIAEQKASQCMDEHCQVVGIGRTVNFAAQNNVHTLPREFLETRMKSGVPMVIMYFDLKSIIFGLGYEAVHGFFVSAFSSDIDFKKHNIKFLQKY